MYTSFFTDSEPSLDGQAGMSEGPEVVRLDGGNLLSEGLVLDENVRVCAIVAKNVLHGTSSYIFLPMIRFS